MTLEPLDFHELWKQLHPGSTRRVHDLFASSISVASSPVSFGYETSNVFRRKAVFTNAVAFMLAWNTSSAHTGVEIRAAVTS